MSVRAFPKRKDESYKEWIIYAKNVESAFALDEVNCPEMVKVCKAMDIAEDLHLAGWHVKVAPFEGDYPLLQVRSKKKQKKRLR